MDGYSRDFRREPGRGRPRLLDEVRAAIRRRHYSIRTEQAYLGWVRRFVLFHGKRHPLEMGEEEVKAFLSHLAVDRNVAASTQNQALNAIVFLYREVLGRNLAWLDGVERAKKPARLPVVFTREEVAAVLALLDGVKWLAASLLYGSGLRLMECLGLRVKDLEHLLEGALVVALGGEARAEEVAGVAVGGVVGDGALELLERARMRRRVSWKPGVALWLMGSVYG